MKKINKIDTIEYLKIFENAQEHFETAQILAENAKTGKALALLILGIEELVKYQVIMLLMLNKLPFEKEVFPEKGMSVLNDHKLKHNLAKELQEAASNRASTEFLLKLIKTSTILKQLNNYSKTGSRHEALF